MCTHRGMIYIKSTHTHTHTLICVSGRVGQFTCRLHLRRRFADCVSDFMRNQHSAFKKCKHDFVAQSVGFSTAGDGSDIKEIEGKFFG